MHLKSKNPQQRYTKNLNPASIFMKFFRFSDFKVLFGLFRTTQDTLFFVLVVDTFPLFAALHTEIEVAIKNGNYSYYLCFFAHEDTKIE